MSDVMLALAATKDRQKSRDISLQVTAKQDALREAGSIVGRAPWGFEIVKRDGRKVLVPTDAGRNYVPAIFQRVIDGASLRTIAAWLTDNSVPTTQDAYVVIGPLRPWHEAYVGNRLIKNPAYCGHRDGKHSYAVEPVAGKPLVTPTTWQEANEALASRVRRGRDTVTHIKPLVAPLCGECYGTPRPGCASGRSPMYRVFAGTGRNRRAYFRCTGQGPQRKGCGAPMIPVDQLESDVRDAMLGNQMPHLKRVFIPGDDRSNDIARLDERGAAAMRTGDYDAAMVAMAEAKSLRELPRVAPHWEERESEQSEAEYFASLDHDGQRDYLSAMEITADAGGVGVVPRWVNAT
jgi:hypothetical protein